MTFEEAKKIFLNRGYIEVPGGTYYDADKWRESVAVISEWLEQEPCEDCVGRQAAIDAMIKLEQDDIERYGCAIPEGFNSTPAIEALNNLPSVTPKEKIGHWKDCKWWKDSDGIFRSGIDAESQCPMNRIEVYEGNGYCFMFEPQGREVNNG